MGYRTVNEAQHFSFRDAWITDIGIQRGHLVLALEDVTILPENSCNRDIRKMGAKELILQIQHVQILHFIEEGYKVYDADGNLTQAYEDREIPQQEYAQAFAGLVPGSVYAVERAELPGSEGARYRYEISIDANERTYLLSVCGEHDVQEWERFMNREPDS